MLQIASETVRVRHEQKQNMLQIASEKVGDRRESTLFLIHSTMGIKYGCSYMRKYLVAYTNS